MYIIFFYLKSMLNIIETYFYLNKIHWISVILIIFVFLFIKSACRYFYKKMLLIFLISSVIQ